MEFPVTTLYTAVLALVFIGLSDLVTRARRRAKVSLGHGGDPRLERAVRAHGNFVEYVPLGLVLLLLAEAKGPETWVIHLFGAMLLTGRLLHAWGMMFPEAPVSGRFWGTALTWLMVLSAALANLWLLAR